MLKSLTKCLEIAKNFLRHIDKFRPISYFLPKKNIQGGGGIEYVDKTDSAKGGEV